MTLISVYAFVGFFSLLCDLSHQEKFSVPASTVELQYPIGFTVSIPDREGIRLVAFHGKLNEDFSAYEDGGYYSKDITSAKKTKWIYTDKTTRFKIGDVINYWIYVEYYDGRNSLGYRSEFRQFNVTECPQNIMNKTGVCSAPDPSNYDIPDATVEILQPKGFSVSIPDQQGISLFAFHGNINEPLEDKAAGYFARDITSAKNGKWAFTDHTTQLVPGDIIYYWLFVVHKDAKGNPKGYLKENQQYVVPGSKQCKRSQTIWNGENTCSGQLLFEEQFVFTDMSNWTREIRYADEPDYEFVIYDKFKENLYVKNGELHIKPTLADDRFGENFINAQDGYDIGSSCTSDLIYDCKRKPVAGYVLPPVLSARIYSKHYFKFGRIDIRAKLPKGDWIYPQLYLSPKHYEYGGSGYNSGEIRIAFLPGNAQLSNELQGRIMLGTSPKAREFGVVKSVKLNEAWCDSYHIYSLLWQPDSLIFLVDNTEYGQITTTKGFSDVFSTENREAADKWRTGSLIAPFDKEMVIKLGVGVGGHSFPDTVPNKPYTNVEAKAQLKFYRLRDVWKSTWGSECELVVDYVKVYAL